MHRYQTCVLAPGAVGNFNAHIMAYPEKDWEGLSQELVVGHLGVYHWCGVQGVTCGIVGLLLE